MSDRYEDERGVIQDILGPVDSVTHITTRAGAVRGNHIHYRTTQHTWVLSGRLLIVTDDGRQQDKRVYSRGDMAIEKPSVAHAWLALEDTEVLVFTKGPRSGEGYESDTERLKVPLLDKNNLLCGSCFQPGVEGNPVVVKSGDTPSLYHISCQKITCARKE